MAKRTKPAPARKPAAKPAKSSTKPAQRGGKALAASPGILPIPKRILTPVERNETDIPFRFYEGARGRIIFSFNDAGPRAEYEVRLMEIDPETGAIVATHAVNNRRHGALFALFPFRGDVILSARKYQGAEAPVEWTPLEHDDNRVSDEARHVQAITYRDEGRAAIVICGHAM